MRQNLLVVSPEYNRMNGRRVGFYCYVMGLLRRIGAGGAYGSRGDAPAVVVDARNEKEAYEQAVKVYAREHGIKINGPWNQNLQGVV